MSELGMGIGISKNQKSMATEELFVVKDGQSGYEWFEADNEVLYVSKGE